VSDYLRKFGIGGTHVGYCVVCERLNGEHEPECMVVMPHPDAWQLYEFDDTSDVIGRL
jgi:hypothetical protein